jgi:hypothetical protein
MWAASPFGLNADNMASVTEIRQEGVSRLPGWRFLGTVPTGDGTEPLWEEPIMKKLLVVAAAAAALLFGGMSGASAAGVTVCANVNINGQGTGEPQCVSTDSLPAPALP